MSKRNKDGLMPLKTGDTPKPARILGLVRHINSFHNEVMQAKDMTSTIAIKDPRTVKSYYIALARLKLAGLQLKEIEDKLQFALHGKVTAD